MTAPSLPRLDDVDTGPVPVARSISTLLRTMPAPSDPVALVRWLTRKADLFDQIATATADPGLACDARSVAAAARSTVATLTAGGLTAVVSADPGPLPERPIPRCVLCGHRLHAHGCIDCPCGRDDRFTRLTSTAGAAGPSSSTCTGGAS